MKSKKRHLSEAARRAMSEGGKAGDRGAKRRGGRKGFRVMLAKVLARV